jgi:hypothetical protein
MVDNAVAQKRGVNGYGHTIVASQDLKTVLQEYVCIQETTQIRE